ncbi:phosphotransferase [Paenibacillus sp.]|uniref:phosphotransferase n=1 Tax=Paenibacillus sp. TaxID=58172 RepID=UPI0028127F8A|nr:phosphotransferase [Paenibacillus sp.]
MVENDIATAVDADRLQAISNRILAEESGALMEWSCHSIGPRVNNFVTGGVFRISGTSRIREGAYRAWSVIVKVVREDPQRDDPAHYNYWRREIMVYDSGLLRNLPANLVAPQCYAIDGQVDGSVWLWLEDIPHEPRTWEWDDYRYAAGKLGEFHAAYLLGEPLPEAPWLNKQWMRSWIRECIRYRDALDPQTKAILISDRRTDSLIQRFTRLEDSIREWLQVLERLPRTFSHQDVYEQNIMLDAAREEEGKLAVIDWQFASVSGIGEDLGRFLGLAVSRGHVPIDRFGEYRELIISSYISGLKRAGWDGDETLPRIGCLAAFALRSVWEAPKLLKKMAEHPDSTEWERLFSVVEHQLEAASEVERLLADRRRNHDAS